MSETPVWVGVAPCRKWKTDIFFQPKTLKGRHPKPNPKYELAKAICADCTPSIREACLADALIEDAGRSFWVLRHTAGIRGGLDAEERCALRERTRP